MCRLRNIALRDYIKVLLLHKQTPDKVIPMCCYALQVTQEGFLLDKGQGAEIRKKIVCFHCKTKKTFCKRSVLLNIMKIKHMRRIDSLQYCIIPLRPLMPGGTFVYFL